MGVPLDVLTVCDGDEAEVVVTVTDYVCLFVR